jgi:hypothetical protein
VAIALALGACGQLRIGPAMAIQAAGCALLAAWPRRLGRVDVVEPARRLARRGAARLRQHPALAVLALHALGSEALRGLLRPPLSWDSLMYHLMLTTTWLQRHDLAPVFGAYPLNFYGYSPANGSLWLWWWMAPSHSEIYANLAFLPQWALLVLATGAVARRLGARRSWPLAAFLVGLVPTVVRFAATQYVDIFTAACLLAACGFGLAWWREPRQEGEGPAGGAAAGGPGGPGGPTPGALAGPIVPAGPTPGAPAGPSGLVTFAGPSGLGARTGIAGHGVATGISDLGARTAIAGLGVATGISDLGVGTGISDLDARTGISGLGASAGPSGLAARIGISGLAALAGMGLGLAAGAKVIGLVYGGALAAFLLLLAPHAWRRRLPQAALAMLLAVALGGFFYLRNVAHGAGPLALQCEGLPHKEAVRGLPDLPRPSSVAALPHQMLVEGRLARALLGSVDDRRSPFMDLGLGPQALLLLLAVPALAFLPRARRREGLLVGGQILVQVAFWVTVPYAANNHVFANVRYLLPAVGLALAGGIAAAESRLNRTGRAGDADQRVAGVSGVSDIGGVGNAGDRWLAVIAVALAAQDLLQLHTQLSDGVRLGVAVADAAAVALALAPRWRQRLAAPRRAALAIAAALLAAVLAAPWLASFRAADRTRAFDEEYTAHGLNVSLYASGWDWLDRHAGGGTVAVQNAPDSFFLYPAMGPHLSRRAIYVNVNAANLADAAAYPLCQPRVDPSAGAWIANLRHAAVRWLDLSRTPPYPFSMEDGWASARPDLFALRFADANNRIYEVLPVRGGGDR